MKLIILTSKSMTSIIGGSKVFDARAYLCSKEWDDVIRGHSFFITVRSLSLAPTIAGAPSVEIGLKFCQLSPLASKKSS